MYTTDAEASNAIRMFNNYMIRPSWQLGMFSINLSCSSLFFSYKNNEYALTAAVTSYSSCNLLTDSHL